MGLNSQSAVFERIVAEASNIIKEITGNVVGPKQLSMVKARLQRRLLEVNGASHDDYLAMLRRRDPAEVDKLVSLLTTHHTHFFREFVHFELLAKELPRLVGQAKAAGRRSFRIWSAACSRGQEVYSLAMFLHHEMPKVDPDFKFEVWGSDVDPESVAIGRNGVYERREIKEAPLAFLDGMWIRGTGEIANYVKATKKLREVCRFFPANLLSFERDLGNERFDVVFCRNVLIYFEEEQVRDVATRLAKVIHPGGLLISGTSEALTHLNLGLPPLGPSVYSVGTAPSLPTEIASKAQKKDKVWDLPTKLRVLCVDDSSTVLTLLKKIFSSDSLFEVVGTAKDGKEAEVFVQNNEVDVMTLDIHMPNMSGIEYLAANMNKEHPPVVMISSAKREDSESAVKALELGARDFVEKPALANLDEVADEIKSKVKMAALHKERLSLNLDESFSKVIRLSDPSAALRVVFAKMSDLDHLKDFFQSLRGKQPATVLVNGEKGEGKHFFKDALLKKLLLFEEKEAPDLSDLSEGKKFLVSPKWAADNLKDLSKKKRSSVCVFGEAPREFIRCLSSLEKSSQILFEELPNLPFEAKRVATDIFPSTSFACISSEFLEEKKAA